MRRGIAIGLALAALLALAAPAVGRESLTPISAAFDPQGVGTASDPKPFTLTVRCQEDVANPGTCLPGGAAPFSPVFGVSGDFGIAYEDCPTTLPGDTFFGTSCQVWVAFTPKMPGNLSGLLTTGSDFARAALSGVGMPLVCPASACGAVLPPPALPAKPRKCKKPKKRAGAAAKKCRKAKKKG